MTKTRKKQERDHWDDLLDKIDFKREKPPKECVCGPEVNFEGKKEVLGLWISENERAKFWALVLNEIHNRRTEGILIACMDGIPGCGTGGVP
jgi:dsDNA-binding SOS-regulon protein